MVVDTPCAEVLLVFFFLRNSMVRLDSFVHIMLLAWLLHASVDVDSKVQELGPAFEKLGWTTFGNFVFAVRTALDVDDGPRGVRETSWSGSCAEQARTLHSWLAS